MTGYQKLIFFGLVLLSFVSVSLLGEANMSYVGAEMALPIPQSEPLNIPESLLKMVLALLSVLAFAYLLLHKGLGYIIKKKNTGTALNIQDKIMLDPKSALYVVQVDSERILLGSGNGNLSYIKTLSKPNAQNKNIELPVEEPTSKANLFSSFLSGKPSSPTVPS